jgi:hypothetical protein
MSELSSSESKIPKLQNNISTHCHTHTKIPALTTETQKNQHLWPHTKTSHRNTNSSHFGHRHIMFKNHNLFKREHTFVLSTMLGLYNTVIDEQKFITDACNVIFHFR